MSVICKIISDPDITNKWQLFSICHADSIHNIRRIVAKNRLSNILNKLYLISYFSYNSLLSLWRQNIYIHYNRRVCMSFIYSEWFFSLLFLLKFYSQISNEVIYAHQQIYASFGMTSLYTQFSWSAFKMFVFFFFSHRIIFPRLANINFYLVELVIFLRIKALPVVDLHLPQKDNHRKPITERFIYYSLWSEQKFFFSFNKVYI